MALFMAPQPMVFNGKLREVVNLERISSFTYLRATGNNYGYIRFTFDKGNEQLWAYPDDETLLEAVRKLYQLLGLTGEEL